MNQWTLTAFESGLQGEVFPVSANPNKPLRFGASPASSDVVLTHSSAGAAHFTVHSERGKLVLQDLGVESGVLINGQKVVASRAVFGVALVTTFNL